MKKLSQIKRYELYVWLVPAFWLVNLLMDVVKDSSHFPARAVNEIWLVAYLSVVNYWLLEYNLPRMSWKRFFESALLILLQVFLYTIGFFIWRLLGVTLHIFTPLSNPIPIEERIGSLTGYSFESIVVFGVARHIYNYIKLKQHSQQLLIAQQQAELNYLKSQTNPHFLFNTLNNIYSLARDKSDLAPESILRLSKILRYMLYETSAPFTAIGQELKIMEDYIALEKLRYDDSLYVNFSHDLEDSQQGVPPLLLIPLVENAFKHGLAETRDHPRLNIFLSVKNKSLLFTVDNSTGERAADHTLKENIGLSNLRRQLTLLYTDYSLEIQPKDYLFTATLKINLSSHV
ncbi:MAG: histidine kinase [Chitinophaga sp.]|uniref:sensor histidine kinase n=1 Tax=Chitinophaga sp. TaxID=1869181 RepID=UPI0025B8A2E1|nr:histidine kinase [Chitinophaga sp.]MBV8255144.1 histidine kinase [Chitinophaga sp.]